MFLGTAPPYILPDLPGGAIINPLDPLLSETGMANLEGFSEDSFNPIEWLNSACSVRKEDESLERCGTRMRCTFEGWNGLFIMVETIQGHGLSV